MKQKRFGLIGTAGYIAPRHLKAIQETGNVLVASTDINDSVGILDSYFPKSEFFTEFEEFQSFIQDENLKGNPLDFISICSPNHLHSTHIKLALNAGCDVICEKPLVLSIAELEEIKRYEKETNRRVFSILQLRFHPSIKSLKALIEKQGNAKVFEVDLTYITSRGLWYEKSWKGIENKSGGVASNIGVHFFDMLSFVFGIPRNTSVQYKDTQSIIGTSIFEFARVRWCLSINSSLLPNNAVQGEKLTYRSIKIEGKELEFSDGFTELHNESYRNIVAGQGFGIEENRAAIETVQFIRECDVCQSIADPHPLLKKLK
ncbi:MAG: oxidoreductase [Rhodospirillaceae bacterium]|nr:oxidoreductase [Rhodospirillaceae bacterium]